MEIVIFLLAYLWVLAVVAFVADIILYFLWQKAKIGFYTARRGAVVTFAFWCIGIVDLIYIVLGKVFF